MDTEKEIKISAEEFYEEYYGHPIRLLRKLVARIRKEDEEKHIVFLAGDSSLDNKYWVEHWSNHRATNGYERWLTPPNSSPDIAYYLNRHFSSSQAPAVAVNCAIEESTLGQRASGRLLPHDVFIRDSLTSRDILVISVGGNDIALRVFFFDSHLFQPSIHNNSFFFFFFFFFFL